jgi:hypothetical protein
MKTNGGARSAPGGTSETKPSLPALSARADENSRPNVTGGAAGGVENRPPRQTSVVLSTTLSLGWV